MRVELGLDGLGGGDEGLPHDLAPVDPRRRHHAPHQVLRAELQQREAGEAAEGAGDGEADQVLVQLLDVQVGLDEVIPELLTPGAKG